MKFVGRKKQMNEIFLSMAFPLTDYTMPGYVGLLVNLKHVYLIFDFDDQINLVTYLVDKWEITLAYFVRKRGDDQSYREKEDKNQ